MAVYRANEDIIRGYCWCSILDTGVCARCAALDGTAYRKDEKMPPIPLHPRCRCLLLPVMDAKELDMKPGELDRAARPWLRRELKNIDEGGTRKILASGTSQEDFGEWWKTLPEKEQQYSVGPVRTKLLREGKISFSDLVDKSTGRLRTLEELGFTESGKAMANPFAKASNWIRTKIDEMEKGTYQPRGEKYDVGRISVTVMDFIKQKGISGETNIISLVDKDLRHALRDVKPHKIPVQIWENIPDLLAKSKSVFWNINKKALVYGVEYNNIKAKIVIQPDRKIKSSSKGKKTANIIRTGSVISNWSEFENKGEYIKIK